MSIAAFAVSVVAVIVAAGAVVYTRRQTHVVERQLHDQAAPRFTADIVPRDSHPALVGELRLTLDGPADLETVSVVIPKNGDEARAVYSLGRDPAREQLKETLGQFRVGDVKRLPVVLNPDRASPPPVLRVECRLGPDVWAVSVHPEWSGPPRSLEVY